MNGIQMYAAGLLGFMAVMFVSEMGRSDFAEASTTVMGTAFLLPIIGRVLGWW